MSLSACLTKLNKAKPVFTEAEMKQLRARSIKGMAGIGMAEAEKKAVQSMLDEALAERKAISDLIAEEIGIEVPEVNSEAPVENLEAAYPVKKESAIDAALRSVGIDPNASPDKAKALRREADKLMKESSKMLEGIPAGQPIHSTRDRNLRDKSMEKARKASDLYAQAEELDAEKLAKSEQPADAKPQGRIEDFGEKMGGARKDKAAAMREAVSRELSDSDIASMPLSKIWPKESIDQIEDLFVAAVAHAARAEVPAKPKVGYKLKAWVEKVKMVRSLASMMLDSKVTKERFIDGLKANRGLEHFAEKVELLERIDRVNWERIGRVEAYPNSYRYNDAGEKVSAPFVRVEIDGRSSHLLIATVADAVAGVQEKLGVEVAAKKMEFEVRGQHGRYAINKKGDPLYRKLKTFETSKEALDYRSTNYNDLVSAWEAVKLSDNVKEDDVRGKENRPRASEDWRKGKDVMPEQFASDLGFRAVEFGNWVGQGKSAKERQGMLNEAYDAFMDLASIIGVPPKAISLNGSLGLGFGSRGSGKASAHFEPDMLVINLTKTRGAGTLAHEWFHALDNYFQRERIAKGETSQRLEGNHSGDFITYAPENYYVNKRTGARIPARDFNAAIDHTVSANIGGTDIERRAALTRRMVGDPTQWEKMEGVRPEVGESFADLVKALNESPMAKRASLIDKGKSGGYWSRIIERGARSFENYVIHKMMLKGYHNDYLANVIPASEFARDDGRYPYLLDGEIQPVADSFDNLFATIQTKETDKGVAIFNTQPGDAIPESEWLSVGMLEEETSKLLEPFATEIPVLVRDTALDAGIESADDRVTSGAVYNGRIHLFRDGLSDRAAVVRTLWHELLHFGFRRFMTEEQYIAKMGELYMKDSWIRGKAVEWMKSAEAKKLAETKKPGYVRARAVDEALAELAEIMQTEPTGYQNNTKLAQAKRTVSEWIAKLADFFGFKEAAQAWRGYAAQKDARDLIVSTFGKLREGAPPSMLNAKWHYSDPAFMVAWHGSPHDHDKFDSSKIGTGDGSFNYVLFSDDDVSITAKFSRAKSGKGMPVSAIKAIADPIAEKLKNVRNVKVVARQNEIPGLKEQIDTAFSRFQQDRSPENLDKYLAVAKDNIEGAYVNGEMYLVASNLGSAERVQEVLRHEVAHLSVEQMLEEVRPGLYKKFVSNVKMLDKAGNKYIRELAAAVDKSQPKLDANTRAAEIIAQIAERGDHLKDMPNIVRSLWQRIMDGIKAFYKLVFGDKLTDQDVRDIVAQSFRWARGEGDVVRVYGGTENANAQTSRGTQSPESFVRMAIEELAADNDNLFSYKRSNSKTLTGVLSDVVEDSEYLGDMTREDERAESHADRRYGFKTKDDKLFYVYETDDGKVWIDVSRLETGSGGGAVYAAVGNYAFNSNKKFIGDPFGLTPAAVIRRTHHMLSSAIRFGTTRHIDAAEQQIWGYPEDGIEPLDWRGTDVDKVEAMVQTIVETAENVAPSLADFHYDFQKSQFSDAQGKPVTGAAMAANTPRDAGIGEKTARRVVLLRSLLDADRSGSAGGRGGILEKLLSYDNSTMPESMRRLFSRRVDGDVDTGNNSGGTKPPSQQQLSEPAYSQAPVEPLASRLAQQPIPGTAQPPAQPPHQGKIPLQGAQPGNRASWDAPEPTRLDNFIYTIQNKHVDMKRAVEAIKASGAQLADKWDAYLSEELFHGRAAKRTQDFLNTELKPLLVSMAKSGINIDELDQYLHARHAKEANSLIAQRDPGMPDGGSGMTNKQSEDYFSGLEADKRAHLQAAAEQVDAIIANTRDLYVSYGLVSKNQADEWARMFKHYVPLMREDHDGGMGIGQGFSIKGKEVKHRTGSTAAVVDIFANIALQREKAITRGEKNRVAVSLAGLAKLNPNPDFWTFTPVPERRYNKNTGLVEMKINSNWKSADNVIVAKIKDNKGDIQERAVIFNEHNERAVRMANSIHNLDGTQLNLVLNLSAKITRYFASINTQYNPVFGVTNLVRDTQGLLLNLSSTPISGHRIAVLKNIPSALAGIYADMRAERKGHSASSKWAQLWEELQNEGGMTGYRDLYRTSTERADSIRHELNPYAWHDNTLGKIFTAGGTLKVPLQIAQDKAGWLLDWLSDYNQTMEGATRLSAYKVAIEQGMSKPRAASLAKNITVNFNRKGQVGQQAGALYAFFNASMQGSARIGETMFKMDGGDIKTLRLNDAGKAILYGGITLGAMQALALSFAGFDDDEPPEFVRERNVIIPIGGKKYITIPMPLGFHAIPNIGRIATEMALSGFKEPGKRAVDMIAVVVNAFNPIGGGTSLLQMASFTATDPLAALAENKDWTGNAIYKEDRSQLSPTPGFTRNKDTATYLSKAIAEGLNSLTGGDKYEQGMFSPTADQLDYLIGQVTGGVGREVSKAWQTGSAAIAGEELPTYKIPLAGRFYGDAGDQSNQGRRFYENLKRINVIEAGLRGRMKDSLSTSQFKADNPEYRLVMRANYAEKMVSKFRKQKHELVEKDAPREKIKAIEDRITVEMKRLNDAVRMAKEKEAD